jgi:hypothetical protein
MRILADAADVRGRQALSQGLGQRRLVEGVDAAMRQGAGADEVGTGAAGMTAKPRLSTRQGLAEVAPADHPAGTTERGQCLAQRELSVFSSEVRVPSVYPAAAFRLTQGT